MSSSPFSVRKVRFPLMLISSQAKEQNIRVSRNTAECTFDMKDCPMNIPTYAQNLYAYVCSCTFPRMNNNKQNTAGTEDSATGRTSIAECSFVNGGRGADGKPNKAIFMRDGLTNNGAAIMGKSDNQGMDWHQCRVPCSDELKGKGVDEIKIRWVDEFGRLKQWIDNADNVDGQGEDLYQYISRQTKWALTIIIEWEEPIDISRLLDSGTETKFR